MYWFFHAFSNLPNSEFSAVYMPSSVVSTKDELHLFRSWSHPVGQCLRYSVRYKQDFCTSQIQYFEGISKGIYSEENSLFLTLSLPHSSQSLCKLFYSSGFLTLWGGHHLPSHSSCLLWPLSLRDCLSNQYTLHLNSVHEGARSNLCLQSHLLTLESSDLHSAARVIIPKQLQLCISLNGKSSLVL